MDVTRTIVMTYLNNIMDMTGTILMTAGCLQTKIVVKETFFLEKTEKNALFPRSNEPSANSFAFGDCREGQIPRPLGRTC